MMKRRLFVFQRTHSSTSTLFVAVITACLWSVSLCVRDDVYSKNVWSLGVTVHLYCNDSTEYKIAASNAEPVSWMLPDLTVLHGDQGRFQILNNNWTLKIINVSRDDLGMYYCMLHNSNIEWLLLRLGLNVAGPYFEHLWDKYWLNTVVGLTASFCSLTVAIPACLVYHFRYRPQDWDSHQHGRSTSGQLPGNDGTVAVIGIVNKNELYMYTTKL